MALDLKKDWPIFAAAAAAVVGVVALSKRGSQATPVVLGGGTPAGYSEAVQAQAAVSTATLQAQTAAFQVLTTEFGQTERTRLETEAVTTAARLKSQAEAQASSNSLLASIAGGLFGLFSWETTARGMTARAAKRGRLEEAYGAGGWYEGNTRAYWGNVRTRYAKYGAYPYRAEQGVRGLGTGA